MTRWPACLALALLSSCAPKGPIPADAYASLSDRLHARFPLFKDWAELCLANGRRLPHRVCLRFDPPRRWSGVIVQDEYSDNHFYPGRLSATGPNRRPPIYLVADLPVLAECQNPTCRPFSPDGSARRPAAFEVEFVGRRTTIGGRYGHAGMFDHEILIDRMIRQRSIPYP